MPCASNSWPISQLTDLQPGAWHGAQNQEPCPGPNMIFTLAKWVTEDQNITQRNADTRRWLSEVSAGCLGEKLQPWRRGGPLFLESVRGLSQDSLSKASLILKAKHYTHLQFSDPCPWGKCPINKRLCDNLRSTLYQHKETITGSSKLVWNLDSGFWEDQVSTCLFSFIFSSA